MRTTLMVSALKGLEGSMVGVCKGPNGLKLCRETLSKSLPKSYHNNTGCIIATVAINRAIIIYTATVYVSTQLKYSSYRYTVSVCPCTVR